MTDEQAIADSVAGQADSTSGQTEVLYLDTDSAGWRRINEAIESRAPDLVVRGVATISDAQDIVENRAVDCLVVDPVGLNGEIEQFLSTIDRPIILYTKRDPAEIADTALVAADTVVEKGTDGGHISLLAEKIVSISAVTADKSEYALQQALESIERQADDEVAVLLSESGDVVWSSTPLSEFLSEDASLEPVLEQLEDDEPVTVRVGGPRDQYLLARDHQLPAAAGSLRLVLLRDVTETARQNARLSLLELLVDQAQDGLYTLDERGVIDFCNESFAANLGYELDEIRGMHASEVLAPGELTRAQETLQALLDESDRQSVTVDLTFVRKDGTEREVSIHYTLINGADGSYRGLMGVVRDVTERKARERSLKRYRSMVDAMSDHACIYDANGRYEVVNESLANVLDTTPEMLKGELSPLVEHIRTTSDGDPFQELVEGTRDTLRGEYATVSPIRGEIVVQYRFSRLTHDGEFDGVVAVGRDVTDEKSRTEELERQHDELVTLTQVHVLIQDIIRKLGAATTRDEIEQLVCNRLVESELYELAWIGEREGGRTHLTTRAFAGDESYLELMDERAPQYRADDPGTNAVETGDVQIIHDIETDDRMEMWRDEALARDFQSIVVVPITHADTTHAALIIYANRPEVFSERAVDALTVLGEMIGFAFMAVQNRQLLMQDTTLELAFHSNDGACFVDVAAQHDARLEAEDCIDLDADYLQYVRVHDADPSAVLESLLDAAGVVDGRVVRAESDTGLLELTVTDAYEPLLLDVGARPTEIVADPDGITIHVETAPDADSRTILDTLATYAPDIELVSKQERKQPVDHAPERFDLDEVLTERQQEILRTAYRSGYYEWPRDTTAEELAAALDIASPTLHQHLRRAKRNLVGTLVTNSTGE